MELMNKRYCASYVTTLSSWVISYDDQLVEITSDFAAWNVHPNWNVLIFESYSLKFELSLSEEIVHNACENAYVYRKTNKFVYQVPGIIVTNGKIYLNSFAQ